METLCGGRELWVKTRAYSSVFSYEREMDALNIIWERKDRLELILTNVHRTDANRFGIIEHIEKEFKLQIILMSLDVDDIKIMPKGGRNGVMVYIMKSLSFNEINNLWTNALAQEKCKSELSSKNLVRQSVENASSSIASEARKRTIEIREKNGGSKDESNVEKKSRIVWTKEMHQKFLDAIAQLGHDKAFPKKIVELMNVPGLTRENVASHLQKYRMCMKRAQEGFTGSLYDFTDPFGFNTSQGNFRQSHWNPFRMRSTNTTTGYCGFNCYGSRLRTPPNISFLNATQLEKPEHNFRVYGDEKKNVLLSIKDSRVPSYNTSFVGFRLSGDGKSFEFGHNGQLGGDGGIRSVHDSCSQCPSVLSVQQQHALREIGNDNSSHCPSFPVGFTLQQKQQSSAAPPGNDGGEAVRFTCQQQQSSIASLPAILTQQQSSISPPGTDWDEVASFTQPQSSVAPPGTDWGEPVWFTCQQQSSISKLASFTQQQQSSIASLLGVDQNKPAILTQ